MPNLHAVRELQPPGSAYSNGLARAGAAKPTGADSRSPFCADTHLSRCGCSADGGFSCAGTARHRLVRARSLPHWVQGQRLRNSRLPLPCRCQLWRRLESILSRSAFRPRRRRDRDPSLWCAESPAHQNRYWDRPVAGRRRPPVRHCLGRLLTLVASHPRRPSPGLQQTDSSS